MEIGFNSRYLLDIADQIDGETAWLSDGGRRPPDGLHELGDRSAIYVLMPMRVMTAPRCSEFGTGYGFPGAVAVTAWASRSEPALAD